MDTPPSTVNCTQWGRNTSTLPMVALNSTWYSPGSIGALTRSIAILPITATNGPCWNTNMPLCEIEYNWLLNMVVGIAGTPPYMLLFCQTLTSTQKYYVRACGPRDENEARDTLALPAEDKGPLLS